MKYIASNLAPWVRRAEIIDTPAIVLLRVDTVNRAGNQKTFLKQHSDDALRDAKKCFTANFGRSDGKRTVWKKVEENS